MYSQNYALSQKEIIIQHGPLVKRIAHHLTGRLPPSVQADDLIQAGMIGLLEAYKKYDASRGASFETYAGIRIRGAMLDEIRKGDWIPRSVHRNARLLAEKIRELEHQSGKDVRDSEVATSLGVSLKEYHHMVLQATGCKILAFEDLGVSEDVMSEGLSSHLPEPFENMEENDFKSYLTKQISSLSERDRLVLALYYDEELNLREIGEILGVTESRVCQIHGQAMIKLQAKMREWRN